MDYRDVGLVTRGVFDPGKLKVQEDGVHFKSVKTGKTLLIRHVDVVDIEWLRVAKGYEMKLVTVDGQIRKFDGFKESDYGELRDFFKTTCRKEMREVDLCVKGWNWGEATVNGSLLSFLIDSKRAFEIPLKEVSQVTSGKNEVTLEFHQSEEASQSLVEMRFHIPTSVPGRPRLQAFADLCLTQADVMQAVGDAIMTFDEIQTLTPRGRYAIKPYPSFLQLHGKTFDYKIPYDSVTRLFLLPHNDQKQMFFVMALDPPIRQGQTRYYFIIFLLPTEGDDFEVTLSLTEQELEERYGGKMTKHMSGSLYEVFSRVMRALVGKKITVPGTFKNSNEQCAISCSNRATSGYLYPLDKGFIFVHKPAVYIKFDAIVSVNFARMSGSAGISRSFDFELELRDGNVIHFSSIMK
ncbi:FACT complex subunit SSRP1 [Geodia barretti]|uniref:FACT complex subunit SSRP1 n=1 Tax=Geodia barretti TaxID=519541 RepID=A0AA35X851_GEOBA|nr:FACT complex subunit SSRP1 [Geodia barretti]